MNAGVHSKVYCRFFVLSFLADRYVLKMVDEIRQTHSPKQYKDITRRGVSSRIDRQQCSLNKLPIEGHVIGRPCAAWSRKLLFEQDRARPSLFPCQPKMQSLTELWAQTQRCLAEIDQSVFRKNYKC